MMESPTTEPSMRFVAYLNEKDFRSMFSRRSIFAACRARFEVSPKRVSAEEQKLLGNPKDGEPQS